MSESDEKGPWIWKAVMVFVPAFLALTTVLAVVYKITRKEENGLSEQDFAATSFSEAELRDALQKMGQFMGARTMSAESGHEDMRRLSSFVQGTLGTNNLGYQVEESDGFVEEGRIWKSYWVSSRKGNEKESVTMEVCLQDDDASIAALLSLAEWMRGRDFKKRLRLGFLVRPEDSYSQGSVAVTISDLGQGSQGTQLDSKSYDKRPVRFHFSPQNLSEEPLADWQRGISWERYLAQVQALCQQASEMAGEKD